MVEQSRPLIRHGILADAQLLADLGARTSSETFGADNKPEDMTAYLASSFSQIQQAAELADPHSIFFIAEIDRSAVGYARLHASEALAGVDGKNPLELVRLYVSKEWLGRGVGEALMRACIDEARQQGYQTLWLGVWERNSRARAFYRKWGFREVGEHSFQLGTDQQNDILMVRSI